MQDDRQEGFQPIGIVVDQVLGDIEAAVRELERQGPIDTRCHDPNCVSAGRCIYGNDVAANAATAVISEGW